MIELIYWSCGKKEVRRQETYCISGCGKHVGDGPFSPSLGLQVLGSRHVAIGTAGGHQDKARTGIVDKPCVCMCKGPGVAYKKCGSIAAVDNMLWQHRATVLWGGQC
jgi:hypothetical protein